jgi:hypothetical protein
MAAFLRMFSFVLSLSLFSIYDVFQNTSVLICENLLRVVTLVVVIIPFRNGLNVVRFVLVLFYRRRPMQATSLHDIILRRRMRDQQEDTLHN